MEIILFGAAGMALIFVLRVFLVQPIVDAIFDLEQKIDAIHTDTKFGTSEAKPLNLSPSVKPHKFFA